MQPFYLKIAIETPLNRLFDYLPIANTMQSIYAPGQRVLASFGRTQKTGIIISISSKTELTPKQLKPIKELLDKTPLLSNQDIKLLQWAASYYHHPIGDVFAQALPKLLKMGQEPAEHTEKTYALSSTGKQLTLQDVQRAPRQALLHKLLKQQITPVLENLFNELDWNWRPPLKNMVEKGWVTIEKTKGFDSSPAIEPSFLPNAAQQTAIDSVFKSVDCFKAFLLDGVTSRNYSHTATGESV